MANEAQGVVPMLSYEDGAVALDWLARAFGFRETERITYDDGTIAHAEMETGGGLITLATPTPDYVGPRRHRERCEQARLWSQVPWVIDGLLVYVEDVGAHHERAKQAGAVLLSEPEDGPPGRRYRVEDLEGHRWMFMERAASTSSGKD